MAREARHRCRQCGQDFESAAALGGHMGKHARAAKRERAPAAANGRGAHRCRECGKTFQSPWGLVGHQKVHRRAARGNGRQAARPTCPTCSHVLPARVRNLANQFIRGGLAEEQAIKFAALAQASLKA